MTWAHRLSETQGLKLGFGSTAETERTGLGDQLNVQCLERGRCGRALASFMPCNFKSYGLSLSTSAHVIT